MNNFLRIWFAALSGSAIFGLLDGFRVVAFTVDPPPANPVQWAGLFLLGAVAHYMALGALTGLCAALAAVTLRHLQCFRNIQSVPFGLAMFLSLLLTGLAFVWARYNTETVAGLSRRDLGLWMVVGGGIVAGGLAVSAIYLGLLAVRRRLAPLARTWRPLARCLLFAVILSALFIPWIRVASRSIPLAGSALTYRHSPANQAATTSRETDAVSGPAPNVILITIEATRADHMNFMGYDRRITTPNLDLLAAQGTIFTEAYSASPWTRPSMASIFSSLYPVQHGVRRLRVGFSPEVTTLAGVLNTNGYRTVTLPGNRYAWSPTFGFQESIRRFQERWSGTHRHLFIATLSRLIFDSIFRLSISWDFQNYNDAEMINTKVMDWLDSVRDEPFLLHIHYVDPHSPYFDHPNNWLQWDPRTEWNKERLEARYDGEILFMDQAVNDLVNELENRALLDDALLIVTADHGEEFLDHGGWGHRHQLHKELLHVPLIIRWPGGGHAGTRVSTPASAIDLAPTILAALDLEIPLEFEGQPLQPFLEKPQQPRSILAQREGKGQIDTWIERDWKLIRYESGELTLYDRRVDASEQNNVAGEHPEQARKMQERLDSFLSGLNTKRPQGERETVDQHELEQIRTLGYVE